MKHGILSIAAAFMLFILNSLCISAQTDSDSIRSVSTDSLNCKTDEELLNYSDSLYNLMFPQPDAAINTNYSDEIAGSTNTRITNEFTDNTHVPSSLTIDHTKIVGEIPYMSGSTATGGKTYTIPIQGYNPDGIFAPQISLLYNSQQRNGYMGMGWSISGLQTITRGNKSIYYDNASLGMNMDKEDAFFLNGTRLIRTSTSSTEILYESETGHVKVIGYCSGNTITYFKVFFPDGQCGIFGNASNSSNKFIYPLTVLTDDKGNTISYEYTEEYFDCAIRTITYNTTCKITFLYDFARQDNIVYYRKGVGSDSRTRLTDICCWLNNNLICKYTLTYGFQDDCSILTQIGYEAGGESLNPLRFYYGTDAQAVLVSDSSIIANGFTFTSPNQIATVRGRFDYYKSEDGVISYASGDSYWFVKNGVQNRIYNMNKPTSNIYLYSGLSDAYIAPVSTLTNGQYFIQMLCADLDGKQQENPIKINSALNSAGTSENIVFTAYQNNHIAGLSQKYVRTFSVPTSYTDGQGYSSIIPKDYFTGDFDGDGRMEIMAVSACNPFGETNHPTKCYIFDLRSDSILMDLPLITYTRDFNGVGILHVVSDYVKCFDYDGDGATDLCHIDENGIRFFSFRINANGLIEPKQAVSFSTLNKYYLQNRQVLWGDFNNDGLIDILLSPNVLLTNDITWKLYTNKGNGDFYHQSFSVSGLPAESIYIAQDMDGDGRTDIVKKTDSSITVYRINNCSFTQLYSYTLSDEDSKIIPISISAATSTCTLFSVKDLSAERISCLRDRSSELLATGMANSLGVIEKNYYHVISKGNTSNYYSMGSDAVFPFVNISEPIAVLAKTENFLNGNLFDRNNINYENAVFHRQGLGFCGFAKITKTNYKGLSTVTTFNPYNFGNVVSTISAARNVSYIFDTTAQGNRIRRNNLISTIDENKLTDVTWTTTYNYDAIFDNLTTVTQTADDYQIVKQTSYINLNDLSQQYKLGIVDSETVSITDGNTSQTTSATVTARDANDSPTCILKKINGSNIEQITLSYNSCGLLTSESIRNFNSTSSLTKTNSYNSINQLTSSTDAMGNTVSYTYDAMGHVSAKTDNSGITAYAYDCLGRIMEENLPDGTAVNNTYTWSGNSYVHKTENTIAPTTAITYDARNREIRSSRQLYNGSYVYRAKEYDIYGRLLRESQPYTSTASSWNSYSYDIHDRMTQKSMATGQTVTYSYSGNTVTEDNGQNAVTRSYDAMGRLVGVEDNTGTTTYTLHANGNPLSVNVLGNSVTFSYDVFGRRTSMNDPSHGVTTCQYDAAGNISQTTDANGNVIQMTYDEYGRMLTKACQEFTTTYTYNDTFNKLASVTSTNNTSKTFAYDAYGRLAVSREYATATIWFQQTHAYDSTGKLASTVYESDKGTLGTESFIYTNQNLSEVQWKDSTIFKITSIGTQGLPSRVSSGPINRFYGYSSSCQPLARIVMRGSQNITNQYNTYSSTTGNIISRRDNLRNITDIFQYDSLDRLTSYGGISVSYDDYGNITAKGDVGTFGYNHTGKPFAVTDVTLSNDSLSALGDQTVTYTSFNRPNTIEGDNYTATFTYNDSYERVRMNITNSLIGPIIGPIHGVSSSSPDAEAQSVIQDGNCILRYYLGGKYEYESGQIAQTERLYLNGDYYSATAVFVKTKHTGIHGLSDITEPSDIMVNATKIKPISLVTTSLRYIVRDHLGSITHVIREDGTVIQELSYDAWGRLRDPQTHEVYAPGSEPTLVLGRGYCGHEHIQLFGLVNMNARLYDPLLGRFLSPDPYVQMPDLAQNYNRYSYCMNNPLMYNDKTGEYFGLDDLIAGVVGGIINLGANLLSGSIDDVWEGLAAFGAGAVAGIGALYPEAGGWLWGGAVVGATNSWIAGGSIGDMLLNATIGAISSFAGGLAGQWAAKNVGGFIINNLQIESPLLGGVVDGAVTGAASGYASGSVAGLLYTGDFSKAHKMGISGLSTGGITGGISCGFSALRYCRQNNINPLTGKHECPYYMTEKEFLKSYNHSNSNKHPTNKLFGITDDALKLHILDLIEENSYLLHQNQNTLRVDINNIPMIFRVNVDGLTIRSFDLFQYNGGYIRSATPVYYLPNQYW